MTKELARYFFMLIEEKVFLSIKSMRLRALKDYNIFLPAWVFEWVKENKE